MYTLKHWFSFFLVILSVVIFSGEETLIQVKEEQSKYQNIIEKCDNESIDKSIIDDNLNNLFNLFNKQIEKYENNTDKDQEWFYSSLNNLKEDMLIAVVLKGNCELLRVIFERFYTKIFETNYFLL